MSFPGEITYSPRIQLHQELEKTRQNFHTLVDSLNAQDWYLPSANAAWTIGETLQHIVMGLQYVFLGINLIQKGLEIPKLSATQWNKLNTGLTRLAARRYNLRTIHHAYDRAYAGLLYRLRSVRELEWDKGSFFPQIDPPFLDGFVTIADLFLYPKLHFEEHHRVIQHSLEILKEVISQQQTTLPEPFTPQSIGVMTYPVNTWQRLAFKSPILFWRLGLGRLVGNMVMLVTHTGRKSGRLHHTVLEYHTIEGIKYSACLFGSRSDWYQNICTDPYVTIQTASGTERVKASRISEARELLAMHSLLMRRDPMLLNMYLRSLDIQPNPVDVLRKKDRIYWVRFDPTDEPTPPAQTADLAWIWLLALIGGLSAWLISGKRRKR